MEKWLKGFKAKLKNVGDTSNKDSRSSLFSNCTESNSSTSELSVYAPSTSCILNNASGINLIKLFFYCLTLTPKPKIYENIFPFSMIV